MAQHDYIISNATFPAVRTDINNALSAIQTTNSGTSRPTGAVSGQLWLDTTSATSPTLKYYDGADDISLAIIDHTANTVNWLDSTVSITGLSTTATGTVLTLSDSANTSTVNLIIDNDKEIRFREATANGTNYISLSAPASLSANVTYTLPVAPTANNQALISSTAGAMSFTPYSFPSSDGTSGQALVTNGSGALSFGSSGLSWDSSVKTASTFTAVVNKGYFVDTTSNAITCTLPASATAGDVLAFVDYARNWGTNKLTLNQNSLNFQGYPDPSPEYNISGQSVQLVYSGATKGWIPTVDDDVTNEVPQSTTISYVVIAGGASGGGYNGGGGGAGGYRSAFNSESSGGGASSETPITVSQGTTITVTVGDGGASVSGNNSGNNGSSSSISGSGFTTISTTGGGYGAKRNIVGGNGGSGGGTGGEWNSASTASSGTANQGYAGGKANTGSTYGGGGGGGAGAVGQDGNSVKAGNGGDGVASTITGTSVTRAGGGGGSFINFYGGAYGTGGSGGGGAGQQAEPTPSAVSGTANTGSGGGGSCAGSTSYPTGAGGKGVVILRMPTAKYTGTTTGSPTVSTSGSSTILTYTGSGSYTS